ncbi:MAG: Ig-like domain-containing protein [Clostridia bacterium]
MTYINSKKNKFKYAIRKVISLILCVVICFNMASNIQAKIFTNLPVSTMTDTFPDSYKPYIDMLKKSHPNWIFKAVNTNLDWNQTIRHETYTEGGMSVSTVHDSLGDEWKKDGKNYYQDGPYVTASRKAVEYVIDPRNSLTEQQIFKFETLSYSEKAHTIEAVQKVLAGTDMGETHKSEYKSAGNWINMGSTYAQIIFNAGLYNRINPIHLATRIKQETSCDVVNNKSINGSQKGYEGVYNFGNIGAVPGKNGNSAVTNGLIYASSQGWWSPNSSIIGCAKELESSYIKWGQNTVYFQKFDVNNTGHAKGLYAYQYMTNIMAPTNESKMSYNAYKNSNMLDTPIEFHIPVYKNMPENACSYPTIGESLDVVDNTKVYLDDTSDTGKADIFRIRLTANDSNDDNIIFNWTETKEGESNRTILTRIQKGTVSGWDKIKFPDGREGFVKQEYVKVHNYTKVDSITLNKTNLNIEAGITEKLIATINPINAKYKNVIWSSSDSSIVSVDNVGNIKTNKLGTAKIKVISEDQLKVAECTVNVVNTVVTGITLESSEYKIVNGKSESIVPTVLPSTAINKEYTIDIADKTIAVIENGKIKGIKLGETTATFTTKDKNKTVSCKIKIVNLEDLDIVIDESLNINKNIITKIEPNTKIEDLLKKLTTSNTIEVLNTKNEVVKAGSNIGTGFKINIKGKDGKIISTYTTLIYGDVNGDGNIDIIDLLSVKQHIENIEKLKDIYFSAAKTCKNSLDIDIIDLLSIKQHIENINKIIQ